MMKARSAGPSERLEEAGLFHPGKRKAQGAGALAPAPDAGQLFPVSPEAQKDFYSRRELGGIGEGTG